MWFKVRYIPIGRESPEMIRKALLDRVNYYSRGGKCYLYLPTDSGEIQEMTKAKKAVFLNSWLGLVLNSKSSVLSWVMMLNLGLSFFFDDYLNSLDNFSKEFFIQRFRGYPFLYAFHTNTAYPHLHLLISPVNLEGKRISFSKKDISEIKRTFNNFLIQFFEKNQEKIKEYQKGGDLCGREKQRRDKHFGIYEKINASGFLLKKTAAGKCERHQDGEQFLLQQLVDKKCSRKKR